MANKRLIVSGCSSTDYCWPTWAHYLGKMYDRYENWAQAGSDNATIVRRFKFDEVTADDTVVIMWSGWNRHVKWNPKGAPTYKDPDNYWEYCYDIWDKNWLVHQYSPIERLAASMDNIRTLDIHSKLVGYDLYHFSLFPWKKGELEENDLEQFNMVYDQYDIQNNFLLDSDLITFRVDNNGKMRYSTEYNPDDPHTGPLINYRYASEVMMPSIKNIPNPQDLMADALRDEDNLNKGIIDRF